MTRLPRPCSAQEAVERAQRLVSDPTLGNGQHVYWIGTGDYRGEDKGPWTTNNGGTGCDCHGLPPWAYKYRRHRPGFNAGGSVTDWDNCDAAIEDATREQDLWFEVDTPAPGDILVWPSVYVKRASDGKRVRVRVGHTALVESVSRLAEWDPTFPTWSLIDVIQVHGPNGRRPAAVRTNAAWWASKEAVNGHGSNPAWRSRILRSVSER